MFYPNKGWALIESTIAVAFMLSMIGVVSGSLQRSNLFQEVSSIVENRFVDLQANFDDTNDQENLRALIEKLEAFLKNNISKQYFMALNLIEYQGYVSANQELTAGSIGSFSNHYAKSILEILASELTPTSDYRYSEYQAKKFLNSFVKEKLATKFLVLRLLIKPERSLVNFLDFFGLESEIYLERIIKI